ncbi:flagellar protein export ATPase FliI [Virgibacillus sp. W0430]|uniref:flagellar protein export ATPase FliI n=1 Tax=Virgibacillus sp. W0430 TaxID=3391580 RepID=UPI003F489813
MNKSVLLRAIDTVDTYKRFGKVLQVVGLMIESQGPAAKVGEVCLIHAANKDKQPIRAEVVGFNNEKIILMPYSEVTEIGSGCLVEATGKPLMIKMGRGLIGKVIDPLGNCLDNGNLPKRLVPFVTEQQAPNPMNRAPITTPVHIGIKAIDTMLTVGEGQRVGIFAGSGVGKSTLLGMIARNSNAHINVIALIGERGREVREFVENELGKDGLERTIVVAVTSDQPALMRIKGAYTATAISEYFRDLGFKVNLMMDSVTRVAMAQREVGLAVGEPPTTKGYTPSVFAVLPKLLERTGTSDTGSITAFYTVLVDGDDMNEPIADTVRGILDGHFVLDRKLAEQGQFPAINILKSISRVMNQVVDAKHREAAQEMRALLATYEENNELIKIGAYKRGTDTEIDKAIAFYPKVQAFLKQDMLDFEPFERSIIQMQELVAEVRVH